MPSYRGPRYRVIRQVGRLRQLFSSSTGVRTLPGATVIPLTFFGVQAQCVCVRARAITGDSLGSYRSSPTPPSPNPDSRPGGEMVCLYNYTLGADPAAGCGSLFDKKMTYFPGQFDRLSLSQTGRT